MYHFVREIKKSSFPNIKGLEFSSFKNQIDFLKKSAVFGKKRDVEKKFMKSFGSIINKVL